MRKHILLSVLLGCFTSLSAANEPAGAVYWERDAALAVIEAAHLQRAVDEIGDISSLADPQATLKRLTHLESRDDWPLPVREAVLYRFTRSLADLPRGAVASEIMQHLREYQAQTLVPFEERPNAFVPLFNIRAAATGVENNWSRAEAKIQALQWLASEPSTLVDHFLQSTATPQQYGYIDGLQATYLTSVIAVQDTGLQRLPDHPELSPLIAATANITGNDYAMRALVTQGQGATLARAFEKFALRLDTAELASLLDFAIHQAPPGNASLAIAAWWPRLRQEPSTRELLFGLLGDANLGSSAVLALSQAPDTQTIKMLQEATTSDSITAVRAQQALDLNRAGLTREDLQ